MYQPWIFRPSGDVYHISFTSPSFLPARMSSLTAVSCFICSGVGDVVGDDVGRLLQRGQHADGLAASAMLDVVSMCVPLVTGCTSSARLPASGSK